MTEYKPVLCPFMSLQNERHMPAPCKKEGCALWVSEKECCAIRALVAPPKKAES